MQNNCLSKNDSFPYQTLYFNMILHVTLRLVLAMPEKLLSFCRELFTIYFHDRKSHRLIFEKVVFRELNFGLIQQSIAFVCKREAKRKLVNFERKFKRAASVD